MCWTWDTTWEYKKNESAPTPTKLIFHPTSEQFFSNGVTVGSMKGPLLLMAQKSGQPVEIGSSSNYLLRFYASQVVIAGFLPLTVCHLCLCHQLSHLFPGYPPYKTNIAPENGWLEYILLYTSFLLGPANFQGLCEFQVSGRVGYFGRTVCCSCSGLVPIQSQHRNRGHPRPCTWQLRMDIKKWWRTAVSGTWDWLVVTPAKTNGWNLTLTPFEKEHLLKAYPLVNWHTWLEYPHLFANIHLQSGSICQPATLVDQSVHQYCCVFLLGHVLYTLPETKKQQV